MERRLSGQVALVAGATRGAGRGIAEMLGEAGATVYCTGRSSRADAGRGRGAGAPFDLARRPETIEETAERVSRRGGVGVALRADHTDPAQVEAVVRRIEAERGRLDVLVNDVWGGEAEMASGAVWEVDPAPGLSAVERVLRTHVLTLRHALPILVRQRRGLVVEVTDGDFPGYRGSFYYDLAKVLPSRLAFDVACELQARGVHGVTALAVTPGFLRSEAMLDHFGVTEETWRDGIARDPFFAHSETPCHVGRAVAALAADPAVARRAGRTWASWTLAREYDLTDVDGRRPDFGAALDAEIDRILAHGPASEGERALLLVRYQQNLLEPARAEESRRIAVALGL